MKPRFIAQFLPLASLALACLLTGVSAIAQADPNAFPVRIAVDAAATGGTHH